MHTNKKTKIFFLIISFACLQACRNTKTWHQATFLYFDTVCEINLLCFSRDFVSAQEEINRVFTEIEEDFSPDAGPASSLQARNLFWKAFFVWKNSQGCFDITVAPLAVLWGFRTNRHAVPTQKSIEKTLSLIGMEKIKPPKEEFVIPDNMILDWGGIAKGYGIDLASQALIKSGFHQGFINAGGDLYCWGLNPENKTWRIGIKHPRQEGFLGVLSLSDMGVATTGDYQRYFIKDGTRYHHIFDPKTGFPARGKQSVTVIGPETNLCDALATALFVSKAPADILKKYPLYGAILVNEQGEISFLGKSFPFQPIN